MDFKVIAVDFDGTLCEDTWPKIGKPNYGVMAYLKEQKKQGAKTILWTCRVDDKLTDAVEWCKERGLEFDAINENIPELVELHGSDTRKVFATEYIDDRSYALHRVGTKKWKAIRIGWFLRLFCDAGG